jgi:hypothetical protein
LQRAQSLSDATSPELSLIITKATPLFPASNLFDKTINSASPENTSSRMLRQNIMSLAAHASPANLAPETPKLLPPVASNDFQWILTT